MKEMEVKKFILELLEMEDDKFQEYIKEAKKCEYINYEKIEKLFKHVKKARH